MKKFSLIFMLFILLSVPLMSIAQEQPPVVLAAGAQPDSLLPDFARTAIAGYAIDVIYSQLVDVDGDGNIVPDLAESWEVSDDQLTWTFHLRQGVKWHDGEPFTAADVKFTFEFPADPEYPGTEFNDQILGATERKAGEADEVSGVQVLDDYTISITTIQPNALFLENVGTTWINPAHAYAGIAPADVPSSSLARAPIGTGPYQLVEWLPDESITFRAFPDYFGTKPNIETYIWRIIPEPATQISELITGGVNIIPAVSADDTVTLESEPGITVLRLTGVGTNYIMFNHNSPLFKDVRVRQALAQAIDKVALLSVTAGGFGTPAVGQVFPELPEANPNLTGYAYDPEAAKALLAEAGWTDDDGDGIVESHGVEGLDDGTPFSVVLRSTTTPVWVNRAQVVQQFLKAVGIEIELEALDFNIFFSTYFTPDSEYDMLLSGWVNLIIPTLGDLTANFESGQANTEVLRWSNSELDDLLNAIPTMFDPADRIAAYWRVQEIIEQEVPVIYLDRPATVSAHSSNLIIPEIGSQAALYGSVKEWKWAE